MTKKNVDVTMRHFIEVDHGKKGKSFLCKEDSALYEAIFWQIVDFVKDSGKDPKKNTAYNGTIRFNGHKYSYCFYNTDPDKPDWKSVKIIRIY